MISRSSIGEAAVMSRAGVLADLVRRRGAGVAIELGVNFVLPVLIYDWAKPAHGDVGALLLSSAPPIVWSLVEFVRRRRIDAMSMLVLAGIVLSLLAFLGGGSVRLLQLREKLVTVLIGFVFLGSAAIGRPLIYQLARAGLARKSAADLAEFESRREDALFKRTMMIMTLVWGVGLIAEAMLSAAVVTAVSVHDYLFIGSVVGNGAMGLLALWSFWFSRRQRRLGRARRDAAARQTRIETSGTS